MHSAHRQVELRRLGNQVPVLGKANSLCMFFKLRLGGGRVGPGIKISLVIVGKICVASRQCTTVPLAPLVVAKILTPAFYDFSSALSRFFVR